MQGRDSVTPLLYDYWLYGREYILTPRPGMGTHTEIVVRTLSLCPGRSHTRFNLGLCNIHFLGIDYLGIEMQWR